MSDLSWQEQAAKTVRTLQIIVAALVAGACNFLVVAVTVCSQAGQPGLALPIPLALILLVFVGLELIARAVVLWSMARKARREIASGSYQPLDPERAGTYLVPVFQNRTIVSAALFQGCAFFAIIAYMAEGAPLSLGLAVILVLVVAAHFPTQSRTIDWVERQIQVVEQEKAVP